MGEKNGYVTFMHITEDIGTKVQEAIDKTKELEGTQLKFGVLHDKSGETCVGEYEFYFEESTRDATMNLINALVDETIKLQDKFGYSGLLSKEKGYDPTGKDNEKFFTRSIVIERHPGDFNKLKNLDDGLSQSERDGFVDKKSPQDLFEEEKREKRRFY